MNTFKAGLKPPPLIRVLKNVLEQNPDNGQILKELLQNAEDAGATEVKFLLDCTTHGSTVSRLFHPALADFQGSALYAYNNAEFADEDWKGICMISHSVKENNPQKIGRFGVGFKSVFHMTDFPGILTGPGVGFIDPHEKYFKDDKGRATTCSAWDLSSDRTEIRSHADQFEPFLQPELFGTSWATFASGCYNGKTLFRFPLRSKGTKLSETTYTPDKVRRLFDDLEKDADIILLFLTNIEKIEIFEKTSNTEIFKTLEIRITDSCVRTVKTQRQMFLEMTRNSGSLAQNYVTFPIEIEVTKNIDQVLHRSNWLLSLYFGEEALKNAESQPDVLGCSMRTVGKKLGVLPTVGTALRTDPAARVLENQTERSCNSGRIFCFLPLPLEEHSPTGLACHVHGTFALDQSRQHVKWPNADQDFGHITDYAIRWNVFLKKNLIPAAMVKLALRLTEGTPKEPNLLYSLMPNMETLKPNWKQVAVTFYKQVIKRRHQLFFAQNMQGYCSVDNNTVIASSDTPEPISQFLLSADVHPIILPHHILYAFETLKQKLKRISPSFIVEILRARQDNMIMSDESKIQLLQYLLETNGNTTNLVDVKLVPLADGSWISFGFPKEKTLFRLPNDRDLQKIFLLSGPSQSFIRPGLSHHLNEGLDKHINKGELTTPAVLQLISKIEGITSSNEFISSNRNEHLTMECLEVIWGYLRHACRYSLQSVEALGLHLIPVDGTQQILAKLNKTMSLLQVNESMENSLIDLFRIFDDIVQLKNLPNFATVHPLIVNDYIFLANARGVIGVLRRAEERQGRASLVRKLSEAPDVCKNALRHFFAIHSHEFSQMSHGDRDFIMILPMFQTLENSGFASSHFVPAMNNQGVQMFPKGISVPIVLLDLDDTETRNLAKMLNISIVGNLSVIVNSVFPGINGRRYESNVMESTMKAIISFFTSTINTNPSFNSQMQKVKFIKKNEKEFASASELYDSDDQAVVALFEGEEKFPVGEFSQPQYKQLLKSIGLKGNENIGIEDLIGLAHEIHQRPDERRAERLMEAVEVKAKSFNDAKQKDIRKYNWIKPRENRGPNYPTSLTFINQLSAPSRVYSDEFINLVGSVAATIDRTKWTNLAHLFKWFEAPQTKDVIEHFANVIEWFQNTNNSDLNKEKQMTLESNYQKQAQRMFDDIYAYLECSLKETAQEKKATQSYLHKRLQDKPCVLVDTWLMLPSRCAFECDFSQSYLPFMGSVPKTTSSNYEELMKAFGVKSTFEAKDYIDVLEDFHNTAGGNPLDHDQIKLALHIINECLIKFDINKKTVLSRIVYIPDSNKTLHPSSEMWYTSTTPGDLSSPITGVAAGMFPCHPGIKEQAAHKFSIQSKARAVLKPFVQPFGQKEKLVSRLKRFLDTNPYSMETLKELIQNTDDAGATKMHFIIDTRNLPDANVFDESWKPLQGPALSIFSDSQFTEADLQGIQDLGDGSKSMDLTKIGQYGVGFNCVYHLTDAPTVLTKVGSEQKLCVLDPMIIHAPFATANSPGCMFTNLDELKKLFPDVFEGYFEEIYGVGSGTIFRFALRKQKSDLSDRVFNVQELETSLMQFFKETIHDYLLFLNNVTEIALKRVNAKTQEIESLFVVHKELSADAKLRVQNFQKHLKEYAASFQQDKLNRLSPSNQREYELILKDNYGKEETWLIVQRLGFEQLQQLPDLVRRSYENYSLNQLPLVGVAYLLHGNKDSRSRKSRIFCFLPLPVTTGLPVHVNGHFALDHDNRRALLNEEIGGQKKGWNMYLLQHVVPPAYCSLICAVRDKLKTKCTMDLLNQYHLLFPELKQCDDRHSQMERKEHAVSLAVYERIGSRNLDILPVNISQGAEPAVLWFKPLDDKTDQTGYFDSLSEFDFSYPSTRTQYTRTSDTDRTAAEKKFREILIKCGFNLFASPMTIYVNFTAAGVKVKKISPETVLQFLHGKKADVFSSFSQVEVLSNVCLILKYCSQWEEFKEHLIGTPFQITQDSFISVFNQKDLKFVSDHSAVAPHALNCFLHKKIAQEAKLSTSADNIGKKPDSALCKHFGIPDFANLLPSLLPETKFLGLEKKVKAESVTDLLSKWPRGKSEHDKAWIKQVWDFLGYEVSSRNVRRKSSGLSPAEFARECLIPLNTWCLLPVTSEAHGDILIPVEKANTIMTDNIKSQLPPDVLNVLQKLGFTILKIDKGVRETNATWLLNLLMNQEQQHASVFVLGVLQDLILQPIPEISPAEQQILLTFLSKNVKEIKKSENFLATVRKLPYFELYEGNHASLDGCMAYILPENIPDADSDVWISAAQLEYSIQRQAIQFFRYSPHILDLIRTLGCRELSLTEVYCLFILKHFDKICATGRFLHMRFIKEDLIQNPSFNQSKQFKAVLQSLKFIRDERTEELCPASRYVDPRVELFKVMEAECSFPPKPFDNDDWLDFLVQNCGLVSEVTEAKLLHYARKLADGLYPNEELESISGCLLDAIVNRKKISSDLIVNVRSVPFIVQHVPSDKILSLHPLYCPQNDGLLQLIPFMGSYASSCSDYVWSNRFLLPPNATFNKSASELLSAEKSLLQNLGVVLQPSPDDIVEHLEDLCQQISPGEKIDAEIDRVLKANFTALEKFDLSLSRDCFAMLSRIDCVKTNGGFLAKPNQMVIIIAKEIPPYLYKLHIELGSHHKLLVKLGVHEETTPDLYASVLYHLYTKYRTSQLSSEDQKVAIRAMQGFLQQLDVKDERAVESSLKDLSELYLPCSDKCLHTSKDVVIPDNRKISLDRLNHFQRPVIDNRSSAVSLQMQTSLEACLKKLPMRLSCTPLTAIVTEKLKRDFREAVVSNAPRKLIADLEKSIRTSEFAIGVVRLIRHLLSGSQNPAISHLTSDILRRKLSRLNILIVDQVTTHLEECNGSIIRDSEDKTPFFLEDNTVYVSQEFCNSQSSEMKEILQIRIAEVLNSIMDNSIEPVLVYLPLILKCSQSEIDKRLDEIQIPQLRQHTEIDNESDYDTADEDESHLSLGQYDARRNTQTETLRGDHTAKYRRDDSDDEDDSTNRNSQILVPHAIETWEMDDNISEDDGGSDDDDVRDNIHEHDEPDSRTFNYEPRTSRKWIEQAGHDLKSANDDSRVKSYEWSCYKFHQAAEKAIKAVLIYRNCPVPLSHNLSEVTEGFPEIEIRQQADALQRLLRNTSSMRYPRRDGKTPRESLSSDVSNRAEIIANRIYEWAVINT